MSLIREANLQRLADIASRRSRDDEHRATQVQNILAHWALDFPSIPLAFIESQINVEFRTVLRQGQYDEYVKRGKADVHVFKMDGEVEIHVLADPTHPLPRGSTWRAYLPRTCPEESCEGTSYVDLDSHVYVQPISERFDRGQVEQKVVDRQRADLIRNLGKAMAKTPSPCWQHIGDRCPTCGRTR